MFSSLSMFRGVYWSSLMKYFVGEAVDIVVIQSGDGGVGYLRMS